MVSECQVPPRCFVSSTEIKVIPTIWSCKIQRPKTDCWQNGSDSYASLHNATHVGFSHGPWPTSPNCVWISSSHWLMNFDKAPLFSAGWTWHIIQQTHTQQTVRDFSMQRSNTRTASCDNLTSVGIADDTAGVVLMSLSKSKSSQPPSPPVQVFTPTPWRN